MNSEQVRRELFMDIIGTRNLRDVLEYSCRRYADKECIVFEDRTGGVYRYSYAQVDRIVNKYAAVLSKRGIARGDRVIVHLLNSPEYLFSGFALAKIGAVMVPTNILARPFEIEYFISFTEAAAVITEPAYVELFNGFCEKCESIKNILITRMPPHYPVGKIVDILRAQIPEKALGRVSHTIIDSHLNDSDAEVPPLEIHNEEDLAWLFTSSSQSHPLVVRLTHANAVFAGIFGAQAWRVHSDDRHLIVLPLYHVNGQLISVMPTLTAGATLVMAEQFSASRFMDQVRRHRVTTTSLVAAALKMILGQPPSERDRENCLRLIMYAIAIPDETWSAFEARFDVRLCDLWGMTETLGATTLNPVDGLMKRNCIGLPRLGNCVAVVDDSGSEVPAGETGELVVQGVPGRTIMKGYYNNDEANKETIRDGWLYTGDTAYMDEDGYFHFVGRKKDMIKRAGHNVAASEVEYVIGLHPKVREATVIDVPDPIREEAVMACVILKKGQSCSEAEIIAWCEERLAKFKVPSFVRFMDSFPRTAAGGVQKSILKRDESSRIKNKQG